MTRFARAKGSKASNERVPEEATSWKEMKQQLEDKKLEVKTKAKRKEIEKTRKENYENFLKETENDKEEAWAEFEEVGMVRKKKIKEVDKPLELKRKRLKVENNEANGIKKTKVASKEVVQKNKTKDKKPYNELTENEKKKVDKKRERRAKQAEKRKLQKYQKSQQNSAVSMRKPPKIRDNKEHKRRKPIGGQKTMMINGIEIKIDLFDGFPVKAEDAERLRKLKKEMISKGIARSEIQVALKLERRRAEKALSREKKKVCFNCRKSGHVLSECPDLNDSPNQEVIGSGICFKCGSTEHTHFECKVIRNDSFKFATCFICKEQGHISRQCPDNNKGLYPRGGACKVCGDVTHLKKDCPKYQAQQEALNIQVDSLSFDNIESLDVSGENVVGLKSTNKVIKF